jgi:hypothetical protein
MNKPEDIVGTPEYNDKKWEPVTKGMTAREAVYAAHVMEEEARYLRSIDRTEISGGTLKYVFPIIRRAVPDLLDGDLTDDMVRDQFRRTADEIFNIDRTGCVIREAPSGKEINAFVDSIAARAKIAVEGLRDVL